MDDYKKELIHFIEGCKGFSSKAKLNLILFASGMKPSAFISLKISMSNLDDKYHFERHLQNAGIIYKTSRARSYEEISKFTGKNFIWKIKGTWYGYDLFKNEKYLRLFKKYTSTAGENHKKADILGGELYGYPKCCIKSYSENHNPEYVKKKYSYYKFYKKLSDADRAFPFVVHTACSSKCQTSRQWNKRHQTIIKKLAPRFFAEFSRKYSVKADLIIDSESDMFQDEIFEKNPIWIEKDGHEYTVISLSKIKGHNYSFVYLTNKWYAKGAVLEAKITMQYDYADIEAAKIKRFIPDVMHKKRTIV